MKTFAKIMATMLLAGTVASAALAQNGAPPKPQGGAEAAIAAARSSAGGGNKMMGHRMRGGAPGARNPGEAALERAKMATGRTGGGAPGAHNPGEAALQRAMAAGRKGGYVKASTYTTKAGTVVHRKGYYRHSTKGKTAMNGRMMDKTMPARKGPASPGANTHK